jgi:hypothetical protein
MKSVSKMMRWGWEKDTPLVSRRPSAAAPASRNAGMGRESITEGRGPTAEKHRSGAFPG